jgi:hypothetical protein
MLANAALALNNPVDLGMSCPTLPGESVERPPMGALCGLLWCALVGLFRSRARQSRVEDNLRSRPQRSIALRRGVHAGS